MDFEKINLLPKRFEGKAIVQRFMFVQVRSSDTHYLYEVKGRGSIHYEVFERRAVPLCIDFMSKHFSKTEGKEIYPKAEDFGKWAFTYMNETKAVSQFEKLSNEKES